MGTWRLLLAWLVIASHTNRYDKLFSIEIGTIAVSTFFFISGFLMPLAYAAHYQNGERGGCIRFYINRLLRLYPIYWASLLCVLGIHFFGYIVRGHTQFDAEILTYVQNFLLIGLNQATFWGGYQRFNNPAWTLDVELQYYLLVPLLVIFNNAYRNILLLIFCSLSCYLYFNPTGMVDIDRSFLSWVIFFVLGLAFYEANIRDWSNILGLVVLLFVTLFIASSMGKDIHAFLITIIFVLFSALLLVFQRDYKFFWFGDRLAGDLSYPVYIFHIVFMDYILRVVEFINLDGFGEMSKFIFTFAVNVIISTAIGYVALKLISDPIDLIRARIRKSS